MSADKKKKSPLAWILIGCVGVLLLSAILVFACSAFVAKKVKDVATSSDPATTAAKVLIGLNPEIELVDENEDGTLTVRNRETGEIATFDVSDFQEGRFSFKTGDTEVTIDPDNQDGLIRVEGPDGEQIATFGGGDLDNLPDWVPVYPDSEAETPFITTSNGQTSGALALVTDDSLAQVTEFFTEAMNDMGIEVQSTSTSGPDGATQILSGSSDGKSMNVVAVEDDRRVRVTVSFGEQ